MDFTKTLHELQHASLFELFRLDVAISKELRDPLKNHKLRARLRQGEHVTYFDANLNQLVGGTILAILQTRVRIKHIHDGKVWNIPFYMLNLDTIETEIIPTQDRPRLNSNTVKVGDQVGYISQSGEEVYGRVIKCNPKTASVIINKTGDEWRIAYPCLFPVIEGARTINNMSIIEGEVVQKGGNQ